MDREGLEVAPIDLIKHAKKHPHTHNISTEAFSVGGRDFVVHNLSMKGDPENDFDVANYRRGLAIIEEIVNFKESLTRIGKKGLRKFNDLMPEYLESKKNHLSGNKYHLVNKNRILGPLQSPKISQYVIYSSRKENGENAQISWDEDGGFWVIGSKNKTLLLSEEKDRKYITNKFEHLRTLSIASLWFRILNKVPTQVDEIKKKLSTSTLVGEICDSVKSGHIVDYGNDARLYFYALVPKDETEFSCSPPSELFNFMKDNELEDYCVKFNTTPVKSYEALHDELKKEVAQVFEAQLEEAGEGTVVYISTMKEDDVEECQSVSKIKTLEYRIYRKLREKLKVFFEKVRKSYDKNLNKYIEEVKQLVRHFNTPQPLEYYFNIARRAFEFCQNQEKAILKFFSNKFITFLKLLQNDKIDKQAFMAVVHNEASLEKVIDLANEGNDAEKKGKMESQQRIVEEKPKQMGKNVLVFVPMTIPSTGKSSLFRKIEENNKDFDLLVLSSDTVREEVMKQKMKRQKSLTKKAAFEKSRKEANERYYKYMGQIFTKIAKSTENSNFLFVLDKNHPDNSLKTTMEEIKNRSSKHSDLRIKVIGVFPLCEKRIEQKPKYMYPFSACYVASCIKRVLSREEHQTLEGTENERANICISFANLFRNFAMSEYNLSKHFDGVIFLPFTKESDLSEQIEKDILTIMLKSKPGKFDEHELLPELTEKLKKWENEETNLLETSQYSKKQISKMFEDFENISIGIDEQKDEEEVPKGKKKSERKQDSNESGSDDDE